MKSYDEYKEEIFKSNPNVKTEYDTLQQEFDAIQTMIDERIKQNTSQQDLSHRTTEGVWRREK